MTDTKDHKSKICVFVSKQFALSLPNFGKLFRDGPENNSVVFDCVSAIDSGNYLNIVAINQTLPGRLPDANLWIPTPHVIAVLLHSDDRIQMGLPHLYRDDIDQDEDALLS